MSPMSHISYDKEGINMKVMFETDEIWPDYVPTKSEKYAEVIIEMSEEEFAAYEYARNTYFTWRAVIRTRAEEQE